ncbi:hypothetical protein [Novosphingobium sp.]|uniref:hypothetical protein n=1 Tax=Novosphingobium sp. TaxID=1874826 RepID=UPI003BACABDC
MKCGCQASIPYQSATLHTTDREGGQHEWTIRSKLQLQASDKLKVTLGGDYLKIDQSATPNSVLAVTPTSETTTTYYYSWGPAAEHGDEAMAQLMIDIATMAFNEDNGMIEAQQRIINTDPSRRPLPTNAGKAITLFPRLMRAQDKDTVERAAETSKVASMEIAE